jgi:hypothetical protein
MVKIFPGGGAPQGVGGRKKWRFSDKENTLCFETVSSCRNTHYAELGIMGIVPCALNLFVVWHRSNSSTDATCPQ